MSVTPQFLRFVPSPGGSGKRGTPGQSPGGSAIKAKQSKLKQHVQAYGKLLQSWQSDVSFMKELIEGIARSQKAIDSVRRCVDRRGLALFVRFPQVDEKIVALLVKDMELYCNALRQHMQGLGDVFAAMQFTSNDALQAVLGEPADALPDDSVFTADHVLDVQQLHSQFSLEMRRKQTLLDALLSSRDSDSHDEWALLPRSSLEECLRSWDDGEESSYIDVDLVRAFLLQNVNTQPTPTSTPTASPASSPRTK